MEIPQDVIMMGGMQTIKNNLNELRSELQKKDKQRLLGQRIFWVYPNEEFTRYQKKREEILNIPSNLTSSSQSDFVIQKVMLGFPDSQETLIGLNLFYNQKSFKDQR